MKTLEFERPWAPIAVSLVLIPFFLACGQKRESTDSAPSKPTSTSTASVTEHIYHGNGVVKATNPKFPSVEMNHEEIKDLMPAMTMEFYVKDVSLLEGLKPGDRVAFTIVDGVGGLKITELRKL